MLARMAHDTGADRIELDISIAREQAVLGFGEAGAEASFPECTAAPVGPVRVLGITLPQMLYQQPQPSTLRGVSSRCT